MKRLSTLRFHRRRKPQARAAAKRARIRIASACAAPCARLPPARGARRAPALRPAGRFPGGAPRPRRTRPAAPRRPPGPPRRRRVRARAVQSVQRAEGVGGGEAAGGGEDAEFVAVGAQQPQ